MTIKVYPGAKRPSHQISLSDGVQTFGLRLEDGPQSLQEIPLMPSTVHFSGRGSKFGDWEPGMSHIEQRTWEGGRANDSFVDDATRYADGKMAWTLTPGKLFPVPNWKFSNGYHTEIHENLPGDMGWRSLYGEYEAVAEPFTHSSGWANYERLYLWVRRVGAPDDLTIGLAMASMGAPSTAKASTTLSAVDHSENEMYLVGVDLDNTNALILTDSYVIAVGNDTDDAANHWEIGVDVDGGTGQYRYSKLTWNAGDFSMYYWVSEAVEDRKFRFFEFAGALYAVDIQADGGNSRLYINGDRGKITGAGSPPWFTDSSKSWTADEWIGCYVKITNGTGAGQVREIEDNTTNALEVTPTWDINPDTTSEYVIFHTDIWQEITPTSGDQIDGVVKSVCVVDDFVCFAQGQSVNILKMRFNAGASPLVHEFDDDGTNKADIVFTHFDAVNDVQVYAANAGDSQINRAPPTAWGTNMTFIGAFNVGDSELAITSLAAHEGNLYAFKPDGRYLIKTDDTAEKTLGEIGFIKSDNNGEAVLSWGLYLYFSWGGYSIQRLYDSSGNYDLSNIGPDRDDGLPDRRGGKCVRLVGTPRGIMAAIQSDEYSSVLVQPQNAFGWHEVFRGWTGGEKVEEIFMQDSYRPRLWISVGGEMVYQDWPRHTFNPLKDSGITYYPEAHLVSSTIDMGVARLPKLIKEISASVENLSSDVEVHLDYQVNEDVDSDDWIYAGVFQVNPADTIEICRGEVYRIRSRLRLTTKDESTPPVVNATVLEGFARTPIKYQYNMRIKISSTQRDLSGISRDVDPDEFITWLKEAAVSSKRIHMRAIWAQMDGRYVVVEPPALLREFSNHALGSWGGTVELSLRDV